MTSSSTQDGHQEGHGSRHQDRAGGASAQPLRTRRGRGFFWETPEDEKMKDIGFCAVVNWCSFCWCLLDLPVLFGLLAKIKINPRAFAQGHAHDQDLASQATHIETPDKIRSVAWKKWPEKLRNVRIPGLGWTRAAKFAQGEWVHDWKEPRR